MVSEPDRYLKPFQAAGSKEALSRIRVLLVVSSPLDPNLTPLNTQNEIERVYSTLKTANLPVALIRLAPPTLTELQSALLSKSFSILHFIGHGTEEGIWLETERGEADFVRSGELAAFVRQGEVPLVLLNTCESWGPAHALADAGVKNVVASKRPVYDSLGPTIASTLYSAITGRHTIIKAVEAAQRVVSRSLGEAGSGLLVALGEGTGRPLPFPEIKLEPGVWIPPKVASYNLDFSLIDNFVDRWEELTGPIYDLLTSPNCRSLALVGLGGIGKSSLAVATAWRYSWLFTDGLVYVTARENPEFGLEEVVRALDRGLDWSIGIGELEVRVQRTLDKLSQSQVLLILDNLDTVAPEQRRKIADFLAHWDTGLGGRAILTMRERLSEFDQIVRDAFIHVDSLNLDSAVELLQQLTKGKRILGFTIEEDLQEIASLTHSHPLLIELTAGLLSGGGTWGEAKKSLGPLTGAYERMYRILDSMVQRLARRHATIPYLLKTWSVFRGGATSEAWEAVISPYIPSLPIGESNGEDGMRYLRHSALFTRDEAGRYKVHPLVGQYLEGRMWTPLPPSEKEQIQKSHIRYFLEYASKATGGAARRLTLLDPEYLNIRVALERAYGLEEWDAVKRLVKNTYKYLDVRGYWQEWENQIQKGLMAAKNTNDQENQLVFTYYQAELCQRQGQWDQSWHYLNKAEKQAENLGVRHILARVCGVRARLLRLQGRFEDARQKYQQSIELLETLGDWGRIATLHGELAELYRQQGNLTSMREHASACYQIETEILGGMRAWGTAFAEMQLGKLATEENDFSGAQELFARALPVLQRGDSSLWLYAELLHAMGILQVKRGRLSSARSYLTEALEVARNLSDGYRVRVVGSDLARLGLDELS
jgi:tetratricopeptide (TPR) repeat protein